MLTSELDHLTRPPMMRRYQLDRWPLAAALLTIACFTQPLLAQVRVVNLIPFDQSGEEKDNSEPTLAVKRLNSLHIAAAAHQLGDDFCDRLFLAGIFVSDDGGQNWALRCILDRHRANMPGDLSMRFLDDDLYVAYLRETSFITSSTKVRLAKTPSFLTGAPMSAPFADWQDFDQPQLRTLAGGLVGNGIFFAVSDFGAMSAACHAATLVASVPPGAPWTKTCLALRPGEQGRHDGARVAVHADGTVYAAYQRVVNIPAACWAGGFPSCYEGDVVVLRGDPAGGPAASFSQLSEVAPAGRARNDRCMLGGDPGPGIRVATCRSFPNDYSFNAAFGQELRASPRLSIAIHPVSSKKVYIAWADSVRGEMLRVHVSVSDNSGQTWRELRSAAVSNATNPALAVDDQGRVGLLYQQVVDMNGMKFWHTRIAITDDDFATTRIYRLAETPAWIPTATMFPYLGDYVDLIAVNNQFLGVFSASNDPVGSQFNCGLVRHRNASATTLLDTSGANVQPSIDPYFFSVTIVGSRLPAAC